MDLGEKIQVKSTEHGFRANSQTDGGVGFFALRAFCDVPVSTKITLATTDGRVSVSYYKQRDDWVAVGTPGPFLKVYSPGTNEAQIFETLLNQQ